MISVDVVQDSDADKFTLWTVHKASLDLSMKCVGGFSRVGGKFLVGPKKLVYYWSSGELRKAAPIDWGLVQAAPNMANNVTLEVA